MKQTFQICKKTVAVLADRNRFFKAEIKEAWNKIHIEICPIWQSEALTNYILIDTITLENFILILNSMEDKQNEEISINNYRISSYPRA